MRINDYALIGDGRCAALVSKLGSVDWLCWPRFDSSPTFDALLDPRGGRWHIAPVGEAAVTRRYVDDTNVLETRFSTATGSVVLTDVMTAVSEAEKQALLLPDHELIRNLICERGEVELELAIDPRHDFAPLRATVHPTLGLRWEVGRRLITLRGDIPVGPDGTARFRLHAGESVSFSLALDAGPAVLVPLAEHARDRIARTTRWWRTWSSHTSYIGPARDHVMRSALAIKLMGYAPSGAVVAAPTTSLPERIGGDLNWDYRFCWLRDASFTARALLRLGYVAEASAFCSWLLHTTRLTAPQLHVIYDVYGNAPPREREVDLRGFAGSRPVRIGNGAARQLQLDMYGEVIDATAQLAQVTGELDRTTQKALRGFGDYVCRYWRLPDQGIWEPRGAPEPHTHSRLLCWVALDRLLDLHERGLMDCRDVARYADEREAIRRNIEDHAWDARRGCYTGAIGNPDLDASVLLMSWYGFHPASSPRLRSTYARIREQLGAGPGLLYRYDESMRNGEGAFWICSFWAVEHLAMGGGTEHEAQDLFSAACSYANDVGLMAEEIDPRTHDAIGNFPQAYTHVGLINAALSIDERARNMPEQHRAPGKRHEVAS
ncbi:MAG TPA: glycoside hydrolase family 15 protein [Kofleriaceae bacterium]|nr:glycoside hydrolase family 15 protein [Kofleriaceae bacterium]